MTHHPTNDDQSNPENPNPLYDQYLQEKRAGGQSNTDSNSGPWRDCNMIEPGCRKKGYCIGHTLPKNNDTDSNAKAGSEVRDIDVPKLAGSEELRPKIRCITGECPAGHENCIYKDFDDDMVEPRTNSIMDIVSQAIAQSSAQAEMRGRIDELEMLRLLCYSGDPTPPKLYSVGKDGMHMTVYDRIKYLKDQLRARGGEK